MVDKKTTDKKPVGPVELDIRKRVIEIVQVELDFPVTDIGAHEQW